jgi:hypothetical protein
VLQSHRASRSLPRSPPTCLHASPEKSQLASPEKSQLVSAEKSQLVSAEKSQLVSPRLVGPEKSQDSVPACTQDMAKSIRRFRELSSRRHRVSSSRRFRVPSSRQSREQPYRPRRIASAELEGVLTKSPKEALIETRQAKAGGLQNQSAFSRAAHKLRMQRINADTTVSSSSSSGLQFNVSPVKRRKDKRTDSAVYDSYSEDDIVNAPVDIRRQSETEAPDISLLPRA